MGFMSKIKNILFEEEEVEIPVIKKEETSVVETPKKKEFTNDFTDYDDSKSTTVTNIEKELQFDFPSFDEEEFESVMPKINTPKEPVVELPKRSETPKVKPYTSKYSDLDVKSSYEIVKEEPKKKFKPSPNISPVYGILDKDYKPQEITPRRKEEKKVVRRGLDVDTVRKKAFGELEDDIELNYDIDNTNSLKEDIINEKQRYNELKGKTIDELLMESSDEEIDVKVPSIKKETKEFSKKEVNPSIEVLDNNKKETDDLEDTLENDLFNLIDSMYEDRKEE